MTTVSNPYITKSISVYNIGGAIQHISNAGKTWNPSGLVIQSSIV